MDKQKRSLLLLLIIAIFLIGCGASTKGKYAGEKTIGGLDVINDDNSTISESIGIGVRYPSTIKGMIDNHIFMETILSPYAISLMKIPKKLQENEIKDLGDKDLSIEEQQKLSQSIDKNTIYFLSVTRIDFNDVNSKEMLKVFTKTYEHRKDIGKIGKTTYYFGYNDNFEQYDLTDKEKEQLKKAVSEIPEFEKSIYLFQPDKKKD